MSGKTARQIRKEMNSLKTDKQKLSDSLVIELLNAPFKYRIKFAISLIFYRRKNNG